MTEMRDAILAACKKAAHEMGKDQLRHLTWFYRYSVPNAPKMSADTNHTADIKRAA